MKYFVNAPYTAETLKKDFRELSKKLHPDTGGNAEDFKAMLNEYEQIARNLSGTREHEAQEKAAQEARQRAEERRREEEEERREREAERKAREEEKRREAERIAKIQEESRAAVRAWAHILERIPAAVIGKKRFWDFEDKKAAAAYVAATKRNIQAVINHYFPGLKVKVTITGQIYKESYEISWQDGPTEKEIKAIPELDFFIAVYYESDPYADYGDYRERKGTAPWREAYGGTLGNCTRCKLYRTLSEEGREQAARIASEYFKDYDPEKMLHRNVTFTATWQEWAKFAHAFDVKDVIQSWECLVRCYGRINGDTTGTIYYSSLTEYLKEYVKVDVKKQEKAPEFVPKYGATYKAIKKALAGNDFCTMQHNEKKNEKEWRPINIFAALLDGLTGVYICKPYNYSDETHWSRLYSSSYTILRNRREKFAALGIELENAEAVKSISAELRAALIREREDIERQRADFENKKAEKATKKAAEAKTTASPDNCKADTQKPATEPEKGADGVDLTKAPAEGLRLEEIPGGVAVVADDWKTTYFNKRYIKAHGAHWNKKAKRWEATDPADVLRLRAWFIADIIEEVNANMKTDDEIRREAAEEIRQEANDPIYRNHENVGNPDDQEPATDTAPVAQLFEAVADFFASIAKVAQEAAKYEGVTIRPDTIKLWREEVEKGARIFAEQLSCCCACLSSLTPEACKDFDALGVIFWTLSDQLRQGADPSAIAPAVDYARAQLFDLVERTQTKQQADLIRDIFDRPADPQRKEAA